MRQYFVVFFLQLFVISKLCINEPQGDDGFGDFGTANEEKNSKKRKGKKDKKKKKNNKKKSKATVVEDDFGFQDDDGFGAFGDSNKNQGFGNDDDFGFSEPAPQAKNDDFGDFDAPSLTTNNNDDDFGFGDESSTKFGGEPDSFNDDVFDDFGDNKNMNGDPNDAFGQFDDSSTSHTASINTVDKSNPFAFDDENEIEQPEIAADASNPFLMIDAVAPKTTDSSNPFDIAMGVAEGDNEEPVEEADPFSAMLDKTDEKPSTTKIEKEKEKVEIEKPKKVADPFLDLIQSSNEIPKVAESEKLDDFGGFGFGGGSQKQNASMNDGFDAAFEDDMIPESKIDAPETLEDALTMLIGLERFDEALALQKHMKAQALVEEKNALYEKAVLEATKNRAKLMEAMQISEEIEALKETVANEDLINQWMNPMHRSKRKLFVQLRDLASNKKLFDEKFPVNFVQVGLENVEEALRLQKKATLYASKPDSSSNPSWNRLLDFTFDTCRNCKQKLCEIEKLQPTSFKLEDSNKLSQYLKVVRQLYEIVTLMMKFAEEMNITTFNQTFVLINEEFAQCATFDLPDNIVKILKKRQLTLTELDVSLVEDIVKHLPTAI